MPISRTKSSQSKNDRGRPSVGAQTPAAGRQNSSKLEILGPGLFKNEWSSLLEMALAIFSTNILD
jgi:hypothetical protein